MIVIALGSNLPGRFADCDAVLDHACRAMAGAGITIIARSRTYLTAPVPASDQPWYHNAAVAVETALSPHDLLKTLRAIEESMGRVRSVANAARIIDLDVIAYKGEIIASPDLTVPHPRMQDRTFVLNPMRDVAPDWTHPGLGKTLHELLAALPAGRQWFADKDVYLMGIVNVTPDSFSDGGRFIDPQSAITHGHILNVEGADILDIGGESTRPGAVPVTPRDEQARILPVVSALRTHFVSVDTRNADTMRACINHGAAMINDVSALTHDPASMDVVAGFDGPVCLMHMQGTPQTMQSAPSYHDVVGEVYEYLERRIAHCVAAGISKGRIVADPGFGFGKSFDHNIALLDHFDRFQGLGVTLMAGVSRKGFVGILAGNAPVGDRLDESLRIARDLTRRGARILRVHDVAATRAFLQLP